MGKATQAELLAQRFGKKFSTDMVIMIHISVREEGIGYTSWGRTKNLHAKAKTIADKCFNTVIDYFDENVKERK